MKLRTKASLFLSILLLAIFLGHTLSGRTEPEALKIAGRIQQKAREVTRPPHKPPLGLSIGVASQNSDYEGILKKADDRMYAQKRLVPLRS